MDKLSKAICDIFMESLRDTEYTNIGEIYHYTGTENILKILVSSKKWNKSTLCYDNESHVRLRFSDIRCLNDFSESKDALEVYKRVCKTSFESDKSFYDIFKDLEPVDSMCVYSDGKHVPCYRFICCFSTDNDLLPMWTYYSKSSHYEGYSVGITKSELLEDLNQYFPTAYQAYMVKMVYQDVMKEDIIRNALTRIHDNMTYKKTKIKYAQAAIQCLLWTWSLTFKNSSFEHEKEVRLVFEIPKDRIRKAEQFSADKKSVEIEYHIAHGLLVPHIDIDFNARVFDSITIGPFSNSPIDIDIQKDILMKYIKDLGFSYVEGYTLKFSKVPVRY